MTRQLIWLGSVLLPLILYLQKAVADDVGGFEFTISYPDYDLSISSTQAPPSSEPFDIVRFTKGPPTITIDSANTTTMDPLYLAIVEYQHTEVVKTDSGSKTSTVYSYSWVQANMTTTIDFNGTLTNTTLPVRPFASPVLEDNEVHNVTIQVFQQSPSLMDYLGEIDINTATQAEKSDWLLQLDTILLGDTPSSVIFPRAGFSFSAKNTTGSASATASTLTATLATITTSSAGSHSTATSGPGITSASESSSSTASASQATSTPNVARGNIGVYEDGRGLFWTIVVSLASMLLMAGALV